MDEKRIRYIDGGEVAATRPPGATYLRVEIKDDQVVLRARLKRVYPLSEPDAFFSIQTEDDSEVAILNSLEGCDPVSRALLNEELDRRYFSPKIVKINRIWEVPGMWSFDVDTNRGQIVFYVRNWRDSSVEIAHNRWHITSVDGQRFEIPNVDLLDRESQTFLEQLL